MLFFLIVFFSFVCLFLGSFSHISTVLGNKFDHGAEAIVPVLFNLIPNCAKVMATSGVSAIRIIIRVRVSRAAAVAGLKKCGRSCFYLLPFVCSTPTSLDSSP